MGVEDAAPSVYGAFDGSYKPVIPVWAATIATANRILKKYLEAMWCRSPRRQLTSQLTLAQYGKVVPALQSGKQRTLH